MLECIKKVFLNIVVWAVIVPTAQAKTTEPQKADPPSQATTSQDDQALEKKIKAQRTLEVDNALHKAQAEQELAALYIEIERLRLEKEVTLLRREIKKAASQEKHEEKMDVLRRKQEELIVKLAIAQAEATQAAEASNQRVAQIDQKMKELAAKTKQLHAEIEHIKVVEARDMHIDSAPVYLKDPLQKDGTLVLSDRCITLNGVLLPWKANYVVDQIQYFNNKDTKHPIFLVIENSPGGYMNAGWRILTAMKNSQAPVYVVVKSFVASMAACITTLATKSYAYPNAEILHHQPWVFAFGVKNVRAQKEMYEDLKRAWVRMGTPIAKKMGISLAALDKKFYEKSMRGDWTEFATEAKKIKWVDHVITGVKYPINKKPQREQYTRKQYLAEYYGLEHIGNAQGTIQLPKFNGGYYYLYNPKGQYTL